MYSISKMTVDSNDNVVSLDWCYENADGKLRNTHTLHTPFGVIPINQVTEQIAIGWLTAQLQNTAAEFDAALARLKIENDYKAGFVEYVPDEQGAFSVYVEPTEPAEDPVPVVY